MTTFLSCTVIGFIPNNVTGVNKVSSSSELFQLASIRRIQPLIKGDGNSSCVLTLVTEENLPKGRMVLGESYSAILAKLKLVIL